MKKTQLQKLILKLIDKKDEHQFNTEYDDGVRRGLALAIVNAKELLKEEKEMVIDAYHQGQLGLIEILINAGIGDSNVNINQREDAEEYFKEKFEL